MRLRTRSSIPLQVPTLVTRRPYIVPTLFGLIFAGVVFFIMVGALAKHQWIWGGVLIIPNVALLTALLLTHRTLKKLEILDIHVPPTYAGTSTKISITLRSNTRFQTLVQCEVEGLDEHVWVTLFPKQPTTLFLPFTPEHRGFKRLPRLGFSTVYPWGVAQTWTWCQLELQHWVYPRLQGPSWKWMQANAILSSPQRGIQGEEFYGLRTYRLGDDKRDIAWKASARSHQLMIRERPRGKNTEDLWLDWKKAPGNVEEKCSCLAKWVVEADRLQLKFGLRLPHETISPARGRHHRHHCLQALALFDGALLKESQVKEGHA